MARVFVLGIAVVDHVFHLPAMPRRAEKFGADRYETIVGGCAATAAVAISRLGGEARLAVRLGDDRNAASIVSALAETGIDTSLCQTTPGALTPVATVLIDAAGERQIVSFRGAGYSRDTAWLDRDAVGDSDAVLVDTRWPKAAARALALARDIGRPGIVDGEPPFERAGDVLATASHIEFSAEGLRALTGSPDLSSALSSLGDRYDAWLAATDGENGVFFTNGARIAHSPALPVSSLDSLGAGDVWHGAFALARGAPTGQMPPRGIEFLDAVVAPIGYIDVVVVVRGDPPRQVEGPRSMASPAPLPEELAIFAIALHPMVQAIDH